MCAHARHINDEFMIDSHKQKGDKRASDQVGPSDVDVEDLPPLLWVRVADHSELAKDTGVIHENIQLPELLPYFCRRSLDALFIRYIKSE